MNIPLTPIRFLKYAAQQFPNKTALVCDSHRFTYAQFAERASRLSAALIAAGAKPGDRVAFLSTNCHRLLEAYYGVLDTGGVLLPLNIRLSPKELSFVLNDAKARFLFFEPSFLDLVESLRHAVPSIKKFYLLHGESNAGWTENATYEDLLREADPVPRDFMEIDEDSLAELFYTSGTSDTPKGVMLSHRNVYLHAMSVIAAFQTSSMVAGQMSCDTVMLHTIPLFHANGWGTAHTITLLGGTHVMVHQFKPSEILHLIAREKVTFTAMVPTMVSAIIHCPERTQYDLTSLRVLMIGGAASSPALVREVEETLGCACISGYGLTETSPVLAISSLKTGVSWTGESKYRGQAMTGFAIPGVEMRVVGESGDEVPRDSKSFGEVLARGDAVMQGYWGRPDATESALEGGWFHTGDVAVVDENNYVLIVDRKKDIIVSGGENISSLEVEKVLASFPGALDVAVIPVASGKWGEVPKALVVLKPGVAASEQELLVFCRERLAHYKCPRYIQFVDALPRTGTGKLLKRELREKYSLASTGTALAK